VWCGKVVILLNLHFVTQSKLYELVCPCRHLEGVEREAHGARVCYQPTHWVSDHKVRYVIQPWDDGESELWHLFTRQYTNSATTRPPGHKEMWVEAHQEVCSGLTVVLTSQSGPKSSLHFQLLSSLKQFPVNRFPTKQFWWLFLCSARCAQSAGIGALRRARRRAERSVNATLRDRMTCCCVETINNRRLV